MEDKRKLIILDLDNTLIFSSYIELDDRELLGIYKFYYVYKRPHVNEFLKFCFSKFDVAIWTASYSEYSNYVSNNLLGGKMLELKFIYTHERCKFMLTPDEVDDEFSTDTYTIKNLKKITRRKFHGNKYHRSRILVIDDDPMTFSKNYGNGIYIPPYTGQNDDIHLLNLIKLLITVLSIDDDWRRISKSI